MYVLIQHSISDPDGFWSSAESSMSKMPPTIKLHHTFPTPDGKRAICVWEGRTINDVRDYVESAVGRFSRNEYVEVVNKEGVVNPRGDHAQTHA
ncbi:MAG TPA: hypothetical protein VIQ74_04485 [Gemmatimonadaceae bacterium]|jgi:hypothetical protein